MEKEDNDGDELLTREGESFVKEIALLSPYFFVIQQVRCIFGAFFLT